MEFITKIDRSLAKAEEVTLALLLVGMVVLAALQVLLRNIWHTGFDWADVSVQNATVLLGLLGGAVATSEGRHLNIDLASRALKGRAKLGLRVVIGLFAAVVCAVLTYGGWEAFKVNYTPWVANIPAGWSAWKNLSVQFAEGSVPQWLSQLFFPFGFGLIGLHFVLRLARDAESLVTGVPWESTDDLGAEGDALLDEMAGISPASSAGEQARAPEEVTHGDR